MGSLDCFFGNVNYYSISSYFGLFGILQLFLQHLFGVWLPYDCLPNVLEYNIKRQNNLRFWLYYFFSPKLFIYVCGLYTSFFSQFMVCFVVVSQVSVYVPDSFF